MIYTIVAVLMLLWLVGLLGSYTLGGLLHILLVVAVILLVINFIRARPSI